MAALAESSAPFSFNPPLVAMRSDASLLVLDSSYVYTTKAFVSAFVERAHAQHVHRSKRGVVRFDAREPGRSIALGRAFTPRHRRARATRGTNGAALNDASTPRGAMRDDRESVDERRGDRCVARDASATSRDVGGEG